MMKGVYLVVWLALSCGSVWADAFEEYELAEEFTLPAGGGVFDSLPDGRLVALAGEDLYLESSIRSRQFDFVGTLQDANFFSFGAAFLRVSPDGQRLATGNSGFGPGAQVGIFEPAADQGVVSVDWYDVQHFDAAWFDDDTLVLTAGLPEEVVTVLDLSEPIPTNTIVIDQIGGASAGIAFDALGNLYTGNGFDAEGASGTGWIKAFSFSEWTAALSTGVPIDFEAAGTLIVDLLSAAALGFDAEGNLHVGWGSDDYAALVRSAAVEAALSGEGPADVADPQQVRTFDPDRANLSNFYDVLFNRITCELLLRQGAQVYVYQGTNAYASEVVEYVQGIGVGVDIVTGEPFNDPASALGRPTVDTTGDGFSVPLDEPVPLVPVNAAFRAFELVSIGQGGSLTLKFNHPVEDDPCNPHGVDFIVFGNAFQTVGGGQPWQNGDPNSTFVSRNLFSEPAPVSVSQDGLEWFTFDVGPSADSFAPTLGRLYDPKNHDRSLGDWNEWWGAPTDPTVPLDPTWAPADLMGRTVAEAALLYGGSAGGTGFDLAALGLEWIQYVRIENDRSFVPEIDAVADVAPSSDAPSGNPDLTGNGVVNASDLALLLGSWGPCACCPADLNFDGVINASDLALLLGAWG